MWCPEDLLIGALNACLMLTFVYEMQLRKLEVLAYESSAQGALEHLLTSRERGTRLPGLQKLCPAAVPSPESVCQSKSDAAS